MDFDCKRSPDTKLDIDLMTLISIQTNTKELKLRVVSSLLFFFAHFAAYFFFPDELDAEFDHLLSLWRLDVNGHAPLRPLHPLPRLSGSS